MEDILPKPLTRKNADGDVYKRLSHIDAAIAQWETVDAKVVASSATSTDYRSSGYIAHETLLNLLRTAGKEQRSGDFYALFEVFMARARRLIRPWLARYPVNPDELLEETCSQLAVMLAEDAADRANDELDFFEVRFAAALRFFVLDRLKDNEHWYSKHQSEEDLASDSEHVEFPHLNGSHDLTEPEKAALSAQINSAIHNLSDEERTILDLRYFKGMKTSSKDLDEETISTKLHLSERTIRNRLTSAATKLSKFKERQ
ncbi:sigma-70 family RNA polymerase sigma factor [Paraburkholderia sp. A3BS-1L]|uniref:sigma-70 family RNA polymerase sigma factor n=1 Tax=Paraburkholderia sp. A3BS-1L TaxID=3028375 RepID=UPI003DA86AE5